EGELGRWRENAIKIAGQQCLADAIINDQDPFDDDIVLTTDHAERGVKIARWPLRHSVAMFNKAMVDRQWRRARSLLDLRQRYRRQATLRDLQRRHGFSPSEVQTLALQNPALFKLETLKLKTSGRPSEVLRFR